MLNKTVAHTWEKKLFQDFRQEIIDLQHQFLNIEYMLSEIDAQPLSDPENKTRLSELETILRSTSLEGSQLRQITSEIYSLNINLEFLKSLQENWETLGISSKTKHNHNNEDAQPKHTFFIFLKGAATRQADYSLKNNVLYQYRPAYRHHLNSAYTPVYYITMWEYQEQLASGVLTKTDLLQMIQKKININFTNIIHLIDKAKEAAITIKKDNLEELLTIEKQKHSPRQIFLNRLTFPFRIIGAAFLSMAISAQSSKKMFREIIDSIRS